MNENKIVVFDKFGLELQTKLIDDTVWLNLNQMTELFKSSKSNISEHLKSIFQEGELNEISTVRNFRTVQKEGNREVKRSVKHYNLDVIISVGYRIQSQRGTQFRIWANKVLKEYLIEGYAINKKRMKQLERTVQVLNLATRLTNEITHDESKEILKVVNDYSKALDLLDKYDQKALEKPKGQFHDLEFRYEDCINIIMDMKYNEKSEIFGRERDQNFQSIIQNLYLTFGGKDLYPTTEEKAASLLYLIIKDHPFIDGNKRIAATIFITFLHFYQLLF